MALQKPTQFTRAYEDFAATAFEARDYDYAAGKMLLLLKEQLPLKKCLLRFSIGLWCCV